jgi:4-amino-4-deoxy-L-arabinose transferase-like glycosyltransferase
MPRLSAWLHTHATPLQVALLALVLAFSLLGMRGAWDPDEGRYSNVALTMLDRGDWIEPHRNLDTGHWTKPPLTYWAVASSVVVLGHTPFAIRLPSALAYLLCVLLAWRIGRRLLPGHEDSVALVYATMFFTVGASQLITTDYVLSACQALAMWGYVEARFGAPARARHWLRIAWLGLALGFLAKGPPALLSLLVMVAADLARPGPQRPRLFLPSGLLLFALVALPWYVWVVATVPGLLDYFLGHEVVGRVASNQFGRNGQWYGWLVVYAPTLLLGSLPWTGSLLRWAAALPSRVRAWRSRAAREGDAVGLLLALWTLLPLLVFCLSRSRLPLYVLPLFLPIALAVARVRAARGLGFPRWPWLLAWAALLLMLIFAGARWPSHKDASRWATAIEARVHGPVPRVVFVNDMARYGLHLHLGSEVRKVSLDPLALPRFSPEFDGDVAGLLARGNDPATVWICKQAVFPAVAARLAALGWQAEPLGAPYQARVLFRVRPRTTMPVTPARDAAPGSPTPAP